MDNPVPRFFDQTNKVLAHLEWEAIRYICFDGSHLSISNAYPKFEKSKSYWLEPFNTKATKEQRQICQRVMQREIKTLEDFYALLGPFLKPRARGLALKDKKVRTAQAAFQKAQLGDAFVENMPLMRKARRIAQKLAEQNASFEQVTAAVNELISEHCERNLLSEAQTQTVVHFVQRQIQKHLNLDSVERRIINADDKNLYFMWGKFKLMCPAGDTIAWSTARAAREAHCSKALVAPIMKKLISLGAIKLIQAGKAGRNSSRAAIYRREV